MYLLALDGADVLVLSFFCFVMFVIRMISTSYNNVVVQVWDGSWTARGR